ncbi:hypothetical protein [Comamonas sp.]|uniref:hypothetical protein n=2 Tax=Comamonas sp. TaxID=34028 RepID=UPI002FC7279C
MFKMKSPISGGCLGEALQARFFGDFLGASKKVTCPSVRQTGLCQKHPAESKKTPKKVTKQCGLLKVI